MEQERWVLGWSDYEGAPGNLGAEGYIHYLHCGDGFTAAYICQN